jgi:hypothetical protein
MKANQTKKFAIISPAPIKGSGGVARIYNFAAELNKSGYTIEIYVFDSGTKNEEYIKQQALEFYGLSGFKIICSSKIVGSYDLAMATRWDTAKIIRDAIAKHKIYLVQDFEAGFNPVGDGSIFAENSYLYGLQPITYGRWLSKKLNTEYGCMPFHLDFTSATDSFYIKSPYQERETARLALCFIYQHDKPRRCPLLGIEALGIVKNLRPNIDIYLVGSDDKPTLWFENISCGILDLNGLNDLYNKCHLGLCLSSSNPSCNPFDMMAAGLPSVELYRENNLYDLPENGITLAHQTPESIAEALIHLLDNPEKRKRMSEYGVSFMKERTAKNELNQFISIIKKIEREENITYNPQHSHFEKYSAKAIVATACQTESVKAHINAQLNSFKKYEKELLPDNYTESESFGLVNKLSKKNTFSDKQSRSRKLIDKIKRWLAF